MIDCRRCRNWQDESFQQLFEERRTGHSEQSYFYGCRIYGVLESTQLDSCDSYEESGELFGFCASCGIAAPKVCLSLGECVNCTDTDLYCVETCQGEGEKKFCSHFQRLLRDGHTLIQDNRCFELYPTRENPKPAEPPTAAPVISLLPEDPKATKKRPS